MKAKKEEKFINLFRQYNNTRDLFYSKKKHIQQSRYVADIMEKYVHWLEDAHKELSIEFTLKLPYIDEDGSEDKFIKAHALQDAFIEALTSIKNDGFYVDNSKGEVGCYSLIVRMMNPAAETKARKVVKKAIAKSISKLLPKKKV